jgi:hypothetical protein
MASRSFDVRSKNEATCRMGITNVCPAAIGYPSRNAMANAFRSTMRCAGGSHNGQLAFALITQDYRTPEKPELAGRPVRQLVTLCRCITTQPG